MKEMQLFMKLEKQDDELYNLVLDKINIFLDQDEYVLYELFGLNSVNEEGEPEECVICMTEERVSIFIKNNNVFINNIFRLQYSFLVDMFVFVKNVQNYLEPELKNVQFVVLVY